MKWWRTYLSLFILETLTLFAINLATGSAAREQFIFNLSLNRLILVTTLFVLLAGAFWLYRLSIKEKEKTINFLDDTTKIFSAIVVSFLALVLDLFLLCLNPDSLGDFTQIYLNFKPFLVWGFIVTLQTWLFSITWFGHRFIGKHPSEDPRKYADELMIVLGIFVLLVVLKLVLVIPTAYGPVIRGDEMRYFEMANYLYFGSFHIEDINHSPYLYPLMLAVSFAFGEHTYGVIKLLNVLYSSSIVFPAFLIARKYFPKKEAVLITLTACFLPFHLLFPRMIMSENLYFPLLLWVIFMILHRPQDRKLDCAWSLLTGITIGLLFLTRYINLVVIPAFYFAWWLIYPDQDRKLYLPSTCKLFQAFLIFAGTLCAYSPWLISGLIAKVPLKLLVGFGIAAETTAGQLTLGNLLTWLLFYLCYFALMAAAVIPFFFAYPLSYFKSWRKESRDWFILTTALMIAFLAACVRHSWRADYNDDEPARIMGRYILYFTLLFMFSAFLAIRELKPSRKTSLVKHILRTVVSPFLIILFATSVLFGNLFDLHDGNLINVLGSVDGAYYQYLGKSLFVLLICMYGVFSYLTWSGKTRNLISISVTTMILFYLAGIPAYYQDLLSYQEYQYIGSKIAELYLDPQHPINGRVRIFTPTDAEERDRALLDNTLHFNFLDGFNDEPIIINFNPDLENSLSASDPDITDIFIYKFDRDSLPQVADNDLLFFNGNYYVIDY